MHSLLGRAEAPGTTSWVMHVTLLTAHPVADSFCSTLAAAWSSGARAAGATVHHFDATALRFDPVVRGAHVTPADDEPDLAKVRAAVEVSQHVTWLFPTWWVGLPAAMKGLVDRLLLPGWAFKYEGGALPRGLMAGRSTRYVTTMDSPRPWYWLAHHDAFGGSFGRGTLRYVGFSKVERTVLYGVRGMSPAVRAKWTARLEALGREDVRRSPGRHTSAAPALVG